MNENKKVVNNAATNNGSIAGGDSQSSIAQKTWEMANEFEPISTLDEIYRFDLKQQQDILTTKPWDKE